MRLLNYKRIERKLGTKFTKKTLLRTALTHSSFLRNDSRKPIKSNETLEFLGDAVLELLTREYLYKKYPKLSEGQLNEIKIKYTNQDTLYDAGKELEIGEFLLMDKGESLTGGRERPSNIAGCLEAIIGAIYLDAGFGKARRFVVKHILTRDISGMRDYKSLLNRWAMKQHCRIGYRVAKSHGPPHHRVFHVDLYINNRKVSRGSGDSKKKAQQAAAREFFEDNPDLTFTML
jgi:ribonuclease-3